MFPRKEYESHFGIVSEEEWAIVQTSINDAIDRMYDEGHPMDD